MKFVEVLEKLSNAYGVAGIEQEVRSLMHKFLKPFADEIRKDELTGEDSPA